MLDGVGQHDQVAAVRLERVLRARGYGDEAGRVACQKPAIARLL